MFQSSSAPSPWRRIVRRHGPESVSDFVEVGACDRCGRGVDRAFPAEYRLLGDKLLCADCATGATRAPSESQRRTPPLGA